MGRSMLPLDERECAECGTGFQAKRHRKTQFCSRSCSGTAAHRKRGDMHGANNPRYNGGLCQREDGRWLINCRDGSLMLFYRGVMAAHLGRLLDESEIVHHRNGDPTDDRLENLEITTRAEHVAMHRAELHKHLNPRKGGKRG